MPEKETKSKYDMRYAKENLKRIPLDVQKEKYEEIKAAAAEADETVNGYIKKAIAAYPALQSPFTITFSLTKDITFNKEIFDELENLLLEYSKYLNGFTRSGSTNGNFFLILKFNEKSDKTEEIALAFKDVLAKFDIPVKWSETTLSPNCATL